jgi:uncharacterized membrane protein
MSGGVMDNLIYGPLESLGYGHPLHPVIVHLVIGPVAAALLAGVAGWIFNKPKLFTTARHMTVVAFVFWFFAVGMGVIDWIHFYHAAPVFAIFVKTIGAGVLFLLLLTNILLFNKFKEESRVPFIFYAASLVCVMVIGFFGGNLVYADRQTPAPPQSISQEGFNRVENRGFTLMWKVNGSNLDVRVRCATTGWIGVGFGTTGTMMGSDIKIGFIRNGKPVILDSWGNAPDSHESKVTLGGKSTITDITGSESNGVTTLGFTRPLNPGSRNDVVLVPGNEYTVIMAHGPEGIKDFKSYHDADRTILKIKL